MDALYVRVSTDRQTTENQFEDLLQVAERDGPGRDWTQIRDLLSRSIVEEEVGPPGSTRTVYRVNPPTLEQLAALSIYVGTRPLQPQGCQLSSPVSAAEERRGTEEVRPPVGVESVAVGARHARGHLDCVRTGRSWGDSPSHQVPDRADQLHDGKAPLGDSGLVCGDGERGEGGGDQGRASTGDGQRKEGGSAQSDFRSGRGSEVAGQRGAELVQDCREGGCECWDGAESLQGDETCGAPRVWLERSRKLNAKFISHQESAPRILQ